MQVPGNAVAQARKSCTASTGSSVFFFETSYVWELRHLVWRFIHLFFFWRGGCNLSSERDGETTLPASEELSAAG